MQIKIPTCRDAQGFLLKNPHCSKSTYSLGVKRLLKNANMFNNNGVTDWLDRFLLNDSYKTNYSDIVEMC